VILSVQDCLADSSAVFNGWGPVPAAANSIGPPPVDFFKCGFWETRPLHPRRCHAQTAWIQRVILSAQDCLADSSVVNGWGPAPAVANSTGPPPVDFFKCGFWETRPLHPLRCHAKTAWIQRVILSVQDCLADSSVVKGWGPAPAAACSIGPPPVDFFKCGFWETRPGVTPKLLGIST